MRIFVWHSRPRLIFIHIFLACLGSAKLSFFLVEPERTVMEARGAEAETWSIPSAEAWASQQFASAPLPDERLKKGW